MIVSTRLLSPSCIAALPRPACKFRIRQARPCFFIGQDFVIFGGLMLATVVLIIRAVQAGEWQGAALVCIMFGYFLWQSGGFFHRNRPSVYTPDKLPDRMLP